MNGTAATATADTSVDPAYLTSRAEIHIFEGKYRQARRLLILATRVKRKALGASHPSVALALNNLGVCLELEGDTASAQRVFMNALRIQRKALGLNHPEVAITLRNLSGLHRGSKDVRPAIGLMWAAFRILLSHYGAGSLEAESALGDLCDLYVLAGKDPCAVLHRANEIYRSQD